MKLSREDILRMVGLTSRGLGSRLNEIEEGIEGAGDTLERYWTQIVKNEREITLIAGREAENETNIAQLQVTAREISARVTTVSNEVDEMSGVVTQHTTKIGELTVSDSQIRASVSTLTTTVNSNTTKIGQLEVSDSQIRASVQTVSDDLDTVSGTVSSHTTKIGQLEVSDTQIRSSVSSLTTTVNGHTQSIGQLEITANQVSQRVTAIEGDYVKEAEISLMVKKDGNGYISNASIKADNIDFTFTRSTNFISNGTTVMNINSSGDLWIKGDLKGGNIQGNYNIGSLGTKMEIYVDETIGATKCSGIRAHDSNNWEVLKLGMVELSGSVIPSLRLNDPNAGQLYIYPSQINIENPISGVSSIFVIGWSNNKVNIQASVSDWPSSSNASVGQVYLDNGYLKIRTS